MIGLLLWILLAKSAISGWQRHAWRTPAVISAFYVCMMFLQHQINVPWRARSGLAPEPIAKAVMMGAFGAIVFFAVYLLFFGIKSLWLRYRPAAPPS